MKTLTLKVPPPLDRALSARAKKQNRTKSAILREALEALLSSRPKAPGTFGEVAGDLAGRFPGPRDLSTNERHMKGFGK